MSDLLDSGERRHFCTGAQRDRAAGKGRCDLLPLQEIADFYYEPPSGIIRLVDSFVQTGDRGDMLEAIRQFSNLAFHDEYTAILDLALQFEDGAVKYDDRNWEKGMPLSWYIDSGMRHYLKYLRGDKDEPHERAFVWNMFCALWTAWNLPELNDLPCAENKVE